MVVRFVGRVIQWTLAAVLIAVIFLVQQALAILVAALRGSGDYVWIASSMGTAANSPFGWLREQEALRQTAPTVPGEAEPDEQPETDSEGPSKPALRSIAGGKGQPAAKAAAKPQRAQKGIRKVGCAVEPGWQVEDVNAEEGHRVEVNEETGIRRLVHSGTGQVMVPDLSTIPSAPAI